MCGESESGGVSGVVVRSDYHGHDALVTIKTANESIVARVAGTRVFERDQAVTIRAHGSVLAWPVERSDQPTS